MRPTGRQRLAVGKVGLSSSGSQRRSWSLVCNPSERLKEFGPTDLKLPTPLLAVDAATLAKAVFMDGGLEWNSVGDVRLDRLGTDDFTDQGRAALQRLSRLCVEGDLLKLETSAGDFAFACSTTSGSRAIAVRDPSGGRPLFYAWNQDAFVAAGDIENVLASLKLRATPNPAMVAAFAAGRFSSYGETMIAGIYALPPGTLVDWENGSLKVVRYHSFHHVGDDLFSGDAEFSRQSVEIFREQLLRAVKRRMPSLGTVGVRLSAGLDSSSLALAAPATIDQSRLFGLNATFPGLSCDEGPKVGSLHRYLPIRWRQFSALDWNAFEASILAPSLEFPGIDALFCAPNEANECVQEGISTMLCGAGGDQVMNDFAVFHDIVRTKSFHLAPRLLLATTFQRAIQRLRLLHASLRPDVPPLQSPIKHPSSTVAWIRSHIRSDASSEASSREGVALRALSSIHNTQDLWALDAMRATSETSGRRLVTPYRDRDLIDTVLGIPWHRRLPLLFFRRLQREVIAGFRSGQAFPDYPKVAFGTLHLERLRRVAGLFPAILGPNALAFEFFDLTRLRQNVDRLVTGRPSSLGDSPPWSLVQALCVEAWLRRLREYNANP